jgi:hypothetical protein
MSGTYVKFVFNEDTNNKLKKLQDILKLDNKHDDFHITLVYNQDKINFDNNTNINEVIKASHLEIFKNKENKNCLVLIINNNDYINSRFQYSLELGATWDYPDYTPHITLSYDIPNENIDELLDTSIILNLTITDEIVEDLYEY